MKLESRVAQSKIQALTWHLPAVNRSVNQAFYTLRKKVKFLGPVKQKILFPNGSRKRFVFRGRKAPFSTYSSLC